MIVMLNDDNPLLLNDDASIWIPNNHRITLVTYIITNDYQ